MASFKNKSQQMGVEEFAEILGITRSKLSRLENGVTPLNLHDAYKIAQKLGLYNVTDVLIIPLVEVEDDPIPVKFLTDFGIELLNAYKKLTRKNRQIVNLLVFGDTKGKE